MLRWEITWSSIWKVIIAIGLVYCAIKLREIFELLIVAMFLSIVLYRIVSWAQRNRWPRWVGLVLATSILLLVVGLLLGLVLPVAIHQASALSAKWPQVQKEIFAHLPQSGPVRQGLDRVLAVGTGPQSQQALGKLFGMLKSTVGGLFDMVIVIALTIYLMVDGERTLNWWIAFFPQERRPRVAAGLAEISHRVVAYVTGQLMVSLLFASYVFVLLTILKVPMALLLAVLAGVVDILPVVGIVIATVPAALIALTVLPERALIVILCYALYHVLESYLVVPKVYGNRLHISTLAVIVAMLIGGVLAGVIGAITALPLVAAYPALERLWLSRQLEPEVLRDHDRLRAA